MASSSHSNQSLKNCDDIKERNIIEEKVSKLRQEGEVEDEQEQDWLQLKLGLGSGTSCRKIVGHESNPVSDSPSSQQVPSNLQIGLGLGLGLGLEWSLKGIGNEDLSSDMVGMELPSDFRNSLLGWSKFIGTVPSWQIDSQDWYMPIPGDSHHYCHTSPHESGLWFTLRSSTNRLGEALPQISKAYIRVKNENMTIFLVKKYLVSKLGLSNENEIDILCMGQSLLDEQSLRHVRDTLWIPALVHSLNSTSKSCGDYRGMSTSNLMPLLYQKYCNLKN